MNYTAFLITDELNADRSNAGVDHFLSLCDHFDHSCIKDRCGPFIIYLAARKALSTTNNSNGKHSGDPRSANLFIISSQNTNEYRLDRHLSIRVQEDSIVFTTDYAATIPVYYSTREGFWASNVEPAITLATDASLSDLDWNSIYGFLRFSHLIWDETCWVHINQALPDNRLTFNTHSRRLKQEKVGTLVSSETRCSLSDKEIAFGLYELNQTLVSNAFSRKLDFILPLSSGYDSRMIFSALVKNKWQDRFQCFTYGSSDSIESYAAKQLCERAGVRWKYIELPCNYLDPDKQQQIVDIFGSSLHMHGMYQVGFIEEISKLLGYGPACVTSGFMTGVPAGQHNGLLKIKSNNIRLSERMSRFSQSSYWLATELARFGIFDIDTCEELVESRFREAFNYHDGPIEHKAVLFDVWTRQRNFISYFPRTIEWLCECISPHMNPLYASYFLSLSPRHLNDRNAVELMFRHCYPLQARTISNSNRKPFMSGITKNSLARIFQSRYSPHHYLPAKLSASLAPEWLRLGSFDLNMKALGVSRLKSFYQFESAQPDVVGFLSLLGGDSMVSSLRDSALDGDLNAYSKCLALQSLCGSLALGAARM